MSALRRKAKRTTARTREVSIGVHASAHPPLRMSLGTYPRSLALALHGDVVAVGGADGDLHLVGLTYSQGLRASNGVQGGALAQDVTPRFHWSATEHTHAVTALKWHPATRRLLSGSDDCSLRIWSISGAEAAEPVLEPAARKPGLHGSTVLFTGAAPVAALAVATQGHRIAWAHGRVCYFANLGNVEQGQQGAAPLLSDLTSIELPSTVAAIAFSPSNKTIAVAAYGGIWLYDATRGNLVKHLPYQGAILSAAFSPLGSMVAGGCLDKSVHFWRIASGRDAQMSGYERKPTAVQWSADNNWLATNGGNEVCLWPFAGKGPEGQAPTTLYGHTAPVEQLAFSPLVNVLISGDRDGYVMLWAPPESCDPIATYPMSGSVCEVGWMLRPAEGELAWAALAASGELMVGRL